MEKQHYYFASDFHLGAPTYQNSREREAKIVAWLDFIKADAKAVFLLGDVFDFWFEYSTVIPKGYIRLQGKLAELSDLGVKIYLFKGNHDMWVFDYFEKELGATVISNEFILEANGKRLFLHHGDGLGAGDHAYKLLKVFFRSRFCQWLFARLHPNLGIGIANFWSKKSRLAGNKREGKRFLEREEEWVKAYSQTLFKEHGRFDYIILGHRHYPVMIDINEETKYVNLGEWVNYTSYAKLDTEKLELLHFEPNK
ncbi:UDP-2,3-diacylglucosamine diphosphatase [Pedobacter sp. SD-b]|uniref:UDP-2,3-diacylglucosamine diphosphatase n=1 Tax=Pedobacter segetis TaxID=2793069 RepID=A0ABS1BJ25_9SPHI|nr:UDP-2,3-diacylglucosamine diphosphatase [Pedobacter segetis]MBK0382882.1 UDP-2,3-diacylglucosamine diphosphatase [Pedobacter segetis]